ncbi:MAG: creatininase family protein [Chloroflexi bacterium]|nr:creatininase family protein [Chloroflexota bacterium]
MRYGDLTYLEIKELIQAGAVALVPTGCTEQQGPHLPVDNDTYWITQVAEGISLAAQELDGILSLVLPTLPFGPTPEHRNYGSGFIDLPQELHQQVIYAVLCSLADQGFRLILLLLGCGQHQLKPTVERFNAAYTERAFAQIATLPLFDIWCRCADPTIPEGHADSFTTSISLFLRYESVRRELIRNPHMTEVDWNDPDLDFSRYSSTGVIGDPTHASAELGARLWAQVVSAGVDELADFIQEKQPAALLPEYE